MNGVVRLAAWCLLAAVVAGCAATPVPAPAVAEPLPVSVAPTEASPVAPVASPVASSVESPPFEPVAVPPPAAAPAPATAPSGSPPPGEAVRPPAPTVTPTPAASAEPPAAVPPAAVPAPTPAATEPSDEQLMAAVVADLQRYAQYAPDEVRRELAVVVQTLNRQRNDANRVRLAVLYTLVRTPQDDQRALQLLDSVAKSGPGSPAIKQLAVVLQVQVAERARAVREEQQKADAAVQKLEALRAMERSLLRDRVRSGGGGGGGGGGSGN